MLKIIQQKAAESHPQVVHLRRAIHQKPELAFEEHETAALVAETLQPLGLQIKNGIAKTGVVAELQGSHPGPTISLRADMDALPITEANEFEYTSLNRGVMHACGHDAHTSCLLGAAMILSGIKDEVRGTIRFLFQPSEEKMPGGAKLMIEDGALDGLNGTSAPEAIFGQHVQPDMPVGTIGVRSGMYMASADEIYLTVRGQGGHAAGPHRLTGDAVLAASQIVVALQSVISRNCPPDVPSVLSIGRFIAEGATNVIPDTVLLEGTFRSMDETWRFLAHELIRRVAEQTAAAYGTRCDVNIEVGYPALYNDPEVTSYVKKAAEAYVGESNVVDLELWFASEDFAWYLKKLPGCFYRIGVGNVDKGIVHGLHTPRFTIDEDALQIGSGFMAYLAWRYGADRA